LDGFNQLEVRFIRALVKESIALQSNHHRISIFPELLAKRLIYLVSLVVLRNGTGELIAQLDFGSLIAHKHRRSDENKQKEQSELDDEGCNPVPHRSKIGRKVRKNPAAGRGESQISP